MDLSDLLPAETASAEATRALGRRLGARLAPGDVVALSGDLGAGKTHLAQGVADGLGLDGAAVTSPTFALVQEHGDGALLHLDLYRVETDDEAGRLGLDELLDGDAVALVEWPERGRAFLPPRTVWLRLSHLGGDRRRVEKVDGGE
ncbi:tRNA (adenosine(37)-N6)-threonylcarbamoyltransferase complex ATPase subunit type 1 TsaE [Rubrivirga sp.]|uniref:tRNA (adenosine(37)-N6)-threonylcarbamoyltransferase complex ATPase subunit type 1 TsaE n=1 Tax=Rubrivirga sp. TaxID=1885344 RepID=UPI003B5290F0